MRTCRVATLTLALAGMLLTGCGNRERAELAMAMDIAAKHPAVGKTIERGALATVFARMALTPEQASAMKQWAETHGQQVRASLEKDFVEMEAALPEANKGVDDMLRSGASTAAEIQVFVDRNSAKVKQLMSADSSSMKAEDYLSPHVDSIRPLEEKLSDRQRLVAIGGWTAVDEAVTELINLPKGASADEVQAKRDAVASALAEARGYGPGPDEAVQAKLRKLVAGCPAKTGDAKASEAQTKTLFLALPQKDAKEQHEDAATTLATLLSEEPAAELLGLIAQRGG